MKKVRDVMTGGAECIGENETLIEAARQMQQLGIGAMPICGTDDKLKGMLTDRDIVIKILASGKDPAAVNAGALGQDTFYYVDADASCDEAMHIMMEHKVRRLPVVSDKRLVGMLSQGDLATSLDDSKVGTFLRTLSAAA